MTVRELKNILEWYKDDDDAKVCIEVSGVPVYNRREYNDGMANIEIIEHIKEKHKIIISGKHDSQLP